MAKNISNCGALDPEACPASDFATLHACARVAAHADGVSHPEHNCVCGRRWLVPAEGRPGRDLVDLVRHIAVTEVRAGDVLVFEVDHSMTNQEMASFKEGVREVHSEDVRVMVLEHARFAGVIRHEHATQLDQRDEQICGFNWRDEHNGTGSEHQCVEPIHTGISEEHQCNCGATRPVTLNDVPPGMAETTSLNDLNAGRRTYLPTAPPPDQTTRATP